MNQEELKTRMHDLKGNIRHFWDKLAESDFAVAKKKIEESKEKVHKLLKSENEDSFRESSSGMRFDDAGIDNDYPVDVDDLPLTLIRDNEPNQKVKYYTTENSELSRGAEKSHPEGIDSFGEEDTFSFEEADDFQTNRDRNQNSDLSKRFYTGGMDLDNLNK